MRAPESAGVPSRSRQGMDPPEASRASLGFFRIWTAHLGRRFGLLQELADAPAGLAPRALAARRKCAPAVVAAWCETANALSMIERKGPRFRLLPKGRRLFADDAGVDYLAGQFSYLALRSLDYEGFDALFAHGTPPARGAAHLAEASAEATRWDHTAFLDVLLPRVPSLRARLTEAARVLDVGSGSGAWDLRMAARFPRCTFLGIEPDGGALRVARRNAAKLGVGKRVRFVGGTAEAVRLREEFDLAYLGEVLSAAKSPGRILRTCHKVLRRGGHVVVAEGLLDRSADPRAGDNPLLYAINLDFALQGARLFSRSELRRRLIAAGFRRPSFLHAGGGLWFVVAAK